MVEFLRAKLFEDVLTGILMGSLLVAAMTVCIEFWELTLGALLKYRTGQKALVSFGEKLSIGIEVVASGTALFVSGQILEGILDHRHLSDFNTNWWAFWVIVLAISWMIFGYWLHAQAAIETLAKTRSFLFRTCIHIFLGGLFFGILILVTTLEWY